MKIIIAGSRGFDNYELLKSKLDFFLSKTTSEIEIVSGTAQGADRLGERYAKEHGYKIHYFPADWNKYGKSAGYRRNEQMAQFADCLVAFWDSKSSGTRHMINLAKQYKRPTRIVRF